jgi:hypothetical protein
MEGIDGTGSTGVKRTTVATKKNQDLRVKESVNVGRRNTKGRKNWTS